MQTAALEVPLTGSESLLSWPAGASLFHEGEEPLGVYVLRSGEVELSFATRQGKTRSLRVARSGQILGISAVVMHRAHECTAIARTRSEVAFISREAFLRSLEETPSLWFGVLHILSGDVNAAYDTMRSMAHR
jgi:CRP-like cAMP-binding protein